MILTDIRSRGHWERERVRVRVRRHWARERDH
jgi:hypothetical protein